jgi:outer membrane protein OmpA-like peptidoglycan-associated protein
MIRWEIAMNILRPLFAASLVAGLFAAFAPAPVAWSQSVDANTIIQTLKPSGKTRSLTRSFGNNQASAADQQFLNTLPTRGIRIEQRKKLDEIVAKQDLPKIDVTIEFDYNSDRIRPDAIASVNELGKALSSDALKGARIVLNGHTDATGTDEYNLSLSDRRAASVRNYLISRFGIPAERLIAIGYGEERLKNAADPQSGENRRVEVINLTQG